MVIDSPWLRLYIVLEYSRSPSTQDDYSSYRWCQQHTGTVLMGYLLVGVNIDRQAVWCVHYWHCVFIRCVGGYIIVYMSYHDTAIVGIIYYCTRIGVSVLRTGPGVQKCSWGSETHANKNLFFRGGGGDFGVFGAPHAPTRGSRGVGKQYTSSSDHDMWPVKILERSGLAVKSYHPETLAAEE